MTNAPFIPETAPFSVEQRAWLNGFLAGMYSSQDGGEATPPAAAKPVTILWGSQTGNAEGLARKLGKTLGGKGFDPTVVDMGEYDAEKLAEESLLLIVTSTYGDGDPPDNAAGFHSYLMGGGAPRLDSLRYSLLALGDSNYPDFCKCGIELDERLRALGAKAIVERVDCDVDFDDAFADWLSAVEAAAGTQDAEGPRVEGEDALAESGPGWGKTNPFPAKLANNVNLNGEGSAKETRHIELSLEGSGLGYEPGDALAVLPMNDAEYVTDLLAAAGFSGDEPAGERSLRDALREDYDVTSLSLKGLKAYAALCGSGRLTELAEDRDAFKAYAWGREFIDLLLEEPHRFESVESFLSLFGKLSPRLYSISSSPRAHPEQVHVTVGVVRYESHGRKRKGVCSNYLAESDGGEPVRIYFHHTNSFKLPEDGDVPVIMVGPGTGIAPFRAFLEERAATGASGRNWLFFGDQREAFDFLYREQLEQYRQSGLLSRLDTAFSRDQEAKVYVQDRMREQGAELYEWLEAGACFYVCGDATRMAKDVDAALRHIVATHGDKSEAEAAAYVEAMRKAKRYQRDVY